MCRASRRRSRCDGGEERRGAPERGLDVILRFDGRRPPRRRMTLAAYMHACMHGTSSPCLALAQSSVRRSSPSFCLLTRKMAKSPLSSASLSLSLSQPSFFGCRVFLPPPPSSLSQLHLMIRSRRRPRPSTQSVSPSITLSHLLFDMEDTLDY